MKDAIMKFVGEYKSFSNFFELKNPVRFENMNYWTVENAYVAGKTMNPSIRYRISQMSPWQAKGFGKKILKEDISANPEWDDNYRVWLMEELIFQKFSLNLELKEKLIETGDRKIIEGNNWHDNFFGICFCGKCPEDKKRPAEQHNHLGIILMDVRGKLK